MNIDVKNALDRVFNACEKIKSMSPKDARFGLITEYVVEDVYDFINAISLTGTEERFQYFNVVYLNGAFSDHAVGDDQKGIPKSLPLFCQVDCEVMKEKGVKIATLFVALLVSELRLPPFSLFSPLTLLVIWRDSTSTGEMLTA